MGRSSLNERKQRRLVINKSFYCNRKPIAASALIFLGDGYKHEGRSKRKGQEVPILFDNENPMRNDLLLMVPQCSASLLPAVQAA